MPVIENPKVGLGDVILATLQLSNSVEKIDNIDERTKARIAIKTIVEYIDEQNRTVNELSRRNIVHG